MLQLAVIPTPDVLPNHDYTFQIGGSDFGFQEYTEGTVLVVGPWYSKVPITAGQGLLLVAASAIFLLASAACVLARRRLPPA